MADPEKTEQPSPALHAWRFMRLGGFDQVRLETGADLLALDQLDPKLWAALSCPTRGLEFDEKTLDLIDTDGDGRIRVPEIIAAAKWAGSLLKSPDNLISPTGLLPLSAIDETDPKGAEVLSSAKEILKNLGKPDETEISPVDTADTVRIFAQTRFNGDGIIPVESAENKATQSAIKDIMTCAGAETDRAGLPGISQEKVDQFFAEAQAYSDWWKEAEDDPAVILACGDRTVQAAKCFDAIKAKVDDYFLRCRLIEFDENAAAALKPSAATYESLASKDLSAAADDIAALPLAAIQAGKSLPLKEGLNPAWAAGMAKLYSEVIGPVFGEKYVLDASEWAQIKGQFEAYETWLTQKKGAIVEPLGLERVRELLSNGARETLTALIEKDKALAPAANAVSLVDRLVRYCRDLYPLLNNFVSFHDFYTPGKKALFQAGTLYLDARSCDLCIKVSDVKLHSSLAQLSRTYLAYCECTRKGTDEKLTIAAAVTNGAADNLMVGRNGVFYDRYGLDWDATITRIIDHPISIRQAFWTPYQRIAQLISEQVAKMSAAREKELQTSVAKVVTESPKKPAPAKAATGQAFDIARFAGIFAAMGLAVGAVGTAIASVVTGFLELTWWKMPLALAGLLLVISGPSMIVAYLKLRKRNLGPILDASGWAVNTRAKINIPFGVSLTRMAALPPGSQRSMQDPFAQKKGAWKYIVLGVVILIAAGFLLYQATVTDRGQPPVAGTKNSSAVAEPAKPAPKPPQPPPAKN